MGSRMIVAAALISSPRGYLLQLRAGHREFPFTWECPGGKVEDGETDEDALKRELLEELAAHSRIGNKTAEYDFDPPVVAKPLTLRFYNVVLLGEHPSPNDAVAVGWFRRDALKHVPLTPGNHRLFLERGWLS